MTRTPRTTRHLYSPRLSEAIPPARFRAATLFVAALAACLLDIACEPPPDQTSANVRVRVLLPDGQLTYMPQPPTISIQPHRYVSWEFSRPTEGIGTVHRNAMVAVSTDGPLRFAVAVDSDTADAPQPNLLRVNTSGVADFRNAPTLPLTPRSEGQSPASEYAIGPGAATLRLDGQDIPVTLHGNYVRQPGHRDLKLGLECALQGRCQFGGRTLAVRIADGDGNGRIGDLVAPMRQDGRLVGRTPGDTVNIDLTDGTFADGTRVIRAMYGQPAYIDGAWWDVRVSSDRRTVSAQRLAQDAGRIRIPNANWEAMVIGANYVFREYCDPSTHTFPLPPGRYVVMRYKQWITPDMTDAQPALLVETPFDRNGPFLLKGDEPTFEVAAGKTIDLPIGTPFQPRLQVTPGALAGQYHISCRLTDASGATPSYVRTGSNALAGLTVTVLDRNEAKLSEVLMTRPDTFQFAGEWSAPNDGPFTAVAALTNCGDFAVANQRVAFGRGASKAPDQAPQTDKDATPPLWAAVRLVQAEPGEHSYTWQVYRRTPARMIYGVLENAGGTNPNRIVATYEGSAESSIKCYTLTVTREADRLKVEVRNEYAPAGAGDKGAAWNTIPWPKGTDLVAFWRPTQAALTDDSYLTLWEGALCREGKEVKRIAFIARLATPQDPVIHILGEKDSVTDVSPLTRPPTRSARQGPVPVEQLAAEQACLAAAYASALAELGPKHRRTTDLRASLETSRKSLANARASLTPSQRDKLLLAFRLEGPDAVLRDYEMQLEMLKARLGPEHDQVKSLQTQVDALRAHLAELDQVLRAPDPDQGKADQAPAR